MAIDPASITYQKLYEQAESLWKDVSAKVEHDLAEFIQDNSHEIILDIARNNDPWANSDIKAIATVALHLSEAVFQLDAIRHAEMARLSKTITTKQEE